MLELDSAHHFVTVVKAGSFRAASRALSIPVSTLSDRVAALERALGVALLVRTTRRLVVTDVGRAYFEKAEAAVALLQSANEDVASQRRQPAGTLRITGPTDFAAAELAAAIRDYRSRFPEVRVETYLTNRLVDVVAEGYDLAIRGGHLPDSGLIARRIGAGTLVLVASEAYLASAPALRHPRDLERHACIGFLRDDQDRADAVWRLRSSAGARHRVLPVFAAASTSFSVLIEHVVLGTGVAQLPWHLVRDELRRGSMVQVLPRWTDAGIPVHLVYPALRVPSSKVREMVSLLEARLRRLLATAPEAKM